MRWTTIAAAAVMAGIVAFTPAARAQQRQGTAVSAESEYCPIALKSGLADDPVAFLRIINACRTGNLLIIPATHPRLIAALCDLGKPSTAAGMNFFCTMGNTRAAREETPTDGSIILQRGGG